MTRVAGIRATDSWDIASVLSIQYGQEGARALQNRCVYAAWDAWAFAGSSKQHHFRGTRCEPGPSSRAQALRSPAEEALHRCAAIVEYETEGRSLTSAVLSTFASGSRRSYSFLTTA